MNWHEVDFIKCHLNQLQLLLIMPQMMLGFVVIKNFHFDTILLYLC